MASLTHTAHSGGVSYPLVECGGGVIGLRDVIVMIGGKA